MNDMPDQAMEDEFATMASWTADVVEELGRSYAVPAGCRGSGSPDALRWLGRAMGLVQGISLLDSGAGVGGPAELAAREFGVLPTLVDPMADACLASSRLFGRPAAVASGERLPFATATFDTAWSLGVLCTVPDQAALLGELVRVLRPGGRIGILAYVATVPSLSAQPEGNHFPTAEELAELTSGAGLVVCDEAALGDFPDAPPQWQAAVSAVEDLIERRHGGDARKVRADEQSTIIGHLLGSGELVGRLLVVRPRDRPAAQAADGG